MTPTHKNIVLNNPYKTSHKVECPTTPTSNTEAVQEASSPNTINISNNNPNKTPSIESIKIEASATPTMVTTSTATPNRKRTYSHDYNYILEKVRATEASNLDIETMKHTLVEKLFVDDKKPIKSGTDKSDNEDGEEDGNHKKKSKISLNIKPDICVDCNQVPDSCLNKLYGKYCINAVYRYYRESMQGKSIRHGHIRDIFTDAHNEIRRVTIYNSYGYFDGVDRDIPECMLKGSLAEAFTLVTNLRLAFQIRDANNKGGTKYLEAMRNHNV